MKKRLNCTIWLLIVTLFVSIASSAALYDCGDAPDSYHTYLNNSGATHYPNSLQRSIYLGQYIDLETDGIPTQRADGDDNNNKVNDEDGVIFTTPLTQGSSATVQVTVSPPGVKGKLNAWIDFNRDGDWDEANEQIINGHTVTGGVYNQTFLVPPNASVGETYARFRVHLVNYSLPSYGFAEDGGEVEDYMIEIVPPTPPAPPTPAKGKPKMNFDFVEVGSDSARAINGGMGSKLHTLATNNLEIKKNQDSGECECCPTCKDCCVKYNKEMIKIGNRDTMAFGFASATNNVKVVINQQ
jgi:hypothetical protein